MELAVYDIKGKETGRKVSVSGEVKDFQINEHAVYLDVKQHLANKRQGTHKSKDKSEINASTKKIKKQKGTGTARAGSVKSGVMVGGGRFFGPKPRDYSFKLNKKVKLLARKSAIADKIQTGNVVVVEDINLANPKTKEFVTIYSSLPLEGKKTTIITADLNKNLYLSSRNIQGVVVKPLNEWNTYNVLNAEKLLIAESAFDEINKIFN